MEYIEHIGRQVQLDRDIVAIDRHLVQDMVEIAAALAGTQQGDIPNWRPFAVLVNCVANSIREQRKAAEVDGSARARVIGESFFNAVAE